MKSDFRVLHVPDSVGGNPPGLAQAERRLGVDSVSVVLRESPFGYRADRVLATAETGRARFEVQRWRLLLQALREYDVVHFNFGRTLVPPRLAQIDLPLLRRAGKAIFVTFQGDDARRGDVARRRGGLSLPVQLPHRYTTQSDREKERRIARFDRYADGIYFLNPDLAHSLPRRATFMPYAHVDVAGRESPPRHDLRRRRVVLHAPSDREVKGTAHVVEAVRRLADEGVDVELLLVEGLPQAEARALYERADIVVDQLFAGWYGGFAVEAMALGIPTVSYIRGDDLDAIPAEMRAELPVLGAIPATLTDVLRSWLTENVSELGALGARSRAYVEKWHDPAAIAARLVDDYRAAIEPKSKRPST